MLNQLAYELAKLVIYFHQMFWTDHDFQMQVMRVVIIDMILFPLMIGGMALVFYEKKANKNSD